VTGRLAWAPVPLFVVVFFWTPPHFWALAMRFKDDYAAAAVPMLPVLATDRQVARRIVAYSWATVVCSLLLWPVARTGPLYPAGAVVLGALLLAEAYRLAARARAQAVPLRPMRLFHWSNAYLALLFLVVAISSALH
jgi:heme o synthase